MLLTIRARLSPGSDLGYLLHKHPDKVQRFGLSFGEAQLFYPELGAEQAEFAMLLQVDPVQLARGRRRSKAGEHPLGGYVNDRPFTANSYLSVAIAQVLGSALGGRCAERPELSEQALELELRLSALPLRGGEALLRRLFEPLGYSIELQRVDLDPEFLDWGESVYASVCLRGRLRLQEALSHLYVLVPVLDRDKHYFVGEAEVEKLLRHGADWLPEHPAQAEIVQRYLLRLPSLARAALQRLEAEEPVPGAGAQGEAALEQPLRLQELRLERLCALLQQSGARSVLDLGCGGGQLLERLLRLPQFEKVWGMDTAQRSLESCARRLRVAEMPPRLAARFELLHGSLCYVDPRLAGFDAAVLAEVLEHIDPGRLAAVEEVVFGQARPRRVLVTTPNRSFNQRFAQLQPNGLRHPDHRFEWDQAEFRAWAGALAGRRGYRLRLEGIGVADPELGPPCQLAEFELES